VQHWSSRPYTLEWHQPSRHYADRDLGRTGSGSGTVNLPEA